MGNGVEAQCNYDGLTLTCGDAAFDRIRDLLYAELSVAEALGHGAELDTLRFIRISRPPREASNRSRFDWLVWIPTIIASCTSGVITVVGLITIARWLGAWI